MPLQQHYDERRTRRHVHDENSAFVLDHQHHAQSCANAASSVELALRSR
jgi:hypothetical protein